MILLALLLLLLAFVCLLCKPQRFLYGQKGKNCILPDSTYLAQGSDFYADKRADTITYLAVTYPAAIKRWEKMAAEDLACFYNSLWMVYNCAAAADFWGPTSDGTHVKLARMCFREICQGESTPPHHMSPKDASSAFLIG